MPPTGSAVDLVSAMAQVLADRSIRVWWPVRATPSPRSRRDRPAGASRLLWNPPARNTVPRRRSPAEAVYQIGQRVAGGTYGDCAPCPSLPLNLVDSASRSAGRRRNGGRSRGVASAAEPRKGQDS